MRMGADYPKKRTPAALYGGAADIVKKIGNSLDGLCGARMQASAQNSFEDGRKIIIRLPYTRCIVYNRIILQIKREKKQ